MSDQIRMTDLAHVGDIKNENVRRFIFSPCALQNVPKPKILLFDSKDENSKIARELPTTHHVRMNTYMYANKSKYQKPKEKDNSNKREPLRRKDFIIKELIEMTKNSTELKNFNLNVSLGVKPKYYQKWARNKKSSYKYIFPSLLEKFQTNERIKTETRQSWHSHYSRRHRKGRTTDKNSGEKVSGSENQTESGDSIDSIRQRESESISLYETGSSNKAEDWQEVTYFDDNDSDSSSSEQSYDGHANNDDHKKYHFGIHDNEKQKTERSNRDKNLHQQITSRSEGRSYDITPNLELLLNETCTANINSELDNSTNNLITNEVNSNEEDGKQATIADEFSEFKDEKCQQIPKRHVQLSTKEISTSLLDSVADPVKSPFNYVRRDSVKFACRRITGMTTNLKLKKNKTGTIPVQTKQPVVLGKKIVVDKSTSAWNINDQVQQFRYRKQNKTLVSEKNLPVPPRKDINRIPVKMADTSPRYTGPENIIVDFESLRIAAHLQRLKTKSNSLQTEVAIKLLKSTKGCDKIPYIDKNGFKTVVSGCVVK